jgi:hypothetical protein
MSAFCAASQMHQGLIRKEIKKYIPLLVLFGLSLLACMIFLPNISDWFYSSYLSLERGSPPERFFGEALKQWVCGYLGCIFSFSEQTFIYNGVTTRYIAIMPESSIHIL